MNRTRENGQLDALKRWTQAGQGPVRVAGLSGSAQSYFFSRFLSHCEVPCLALVPTRKEADRLFKELRFFLGDETGNGDGTAQRLHEYPCYDITPLSGLSPHGEIINRRLQSLHALISNPNPVVITSMEGVAQRTLPKAAFVRALEYFEVGETTQREHLIQLLESAGYQRVSLVEEKGDYAVRGGVVDIYPPLYALPVRMEFWGDRIESIRHFDPLSQRSQSALSELVLLPAREIIMDGANLKRARSMGRLPNQPEGSLSFPGQEAWLNHFYASLDSLLQYLPRQALVALFDPHRMAQAHDHAERKFSEDAERFRQEAGEKGVPFPEIEGIRVPLEELVERLERQPRMDWGEVEWRALQPPVRSIRVEGSFHLDQDWAVKLSGQRRISLAPLAEKISSWVSSSGRVVLVTRTEQQGNRLGEILGNYKISVDQIVRQWHEIPRRAGLSICIGRLSKGFTWPEAELYVISEDEIFGPKRSRPRQKEGARDRALAWSGLSQLKAGDLVVHEEHGIGRYGGLLEMEVQNRTHDFLLIEYARKDRLYVPADRISVLQKYIGVDQKTPRLDRLGGSSWGVAKGRAKKSVRAIARQLVELYAVRKHRKGYAFSMPDHRFMEFEATFEHEETPDQIKAIEAVLEDMTSDQPMDRLICGDVGFGKTEVAIRAAFKAVEDGKQVALLVPTTVLTEQHYATLERRMSPYGIRVGLLSRFKTRAEQRETLARLRSGELDIIVGTHRILQKDVRFKDLGLLIVDEEQRFGVKQKEALKRFRSLVDVLAITATPIPRTLHMSLMGVRDLSVIETPPEDRLAIQSYLSPYDEPLIARAIRTEMERGGQVFFVHNKVQNIGSVWDVVRQLVPEARSAVAHGQMKERALEETMMRFLKKDLDVLVCTSIIEAGLDIPSANTIIINQVDQLGLAQVYQLRGRVGRSAEKAYAYLLLSENGTLTREAERRLKALMDFSHLGAGLHLAMHDLKIRGGGNILGFAQSGQISAVGYELYLKLIEQAIAELKGEEWEEEINPEINMDIPAFLPGDYVMDTDVRLNLYRRLSGLKRASELEALVTEIKDRFGPPPEEVVNLCGVMSLRIILKRLRVSRLDVGEDGLVLTFAPHPRRDPEWLLRWAQDRPAQFQFLSEYKVKIHTAPRTQPPDLVQVEHAILAVEEQSRGH